MATWLAIRCWADELPYGEVIPEGQDDCGLRGASGSALVQIKSRRDHMGRFPVRETAEFVRALWTRSDVSSELILVLERPVIGGPAADHDLPDHPGLREVLCQDPRWETLAPRTRIWITPAPFEQAITAISATAPCAPLAAQVYYAEALNQIGRLADDNGVVKDGHFKGLAISDVESTIRRTEPLLDLQGMEAALRDGYCDTVDFLTPIDDPLFYQGVDTRPGHLAAGLVAERPEERRALLEALEERGAALIIGPSGAGKSALMWDVARASRHTIRWIQVRRGSEDDGHLLIRLARSLRASADAPVGFVVDDVGRGLNSLWDALARESGVGSGIIVLGSIREEDVFLLTTRARTREFRSEVDEAVAERIWQQLRDDGRTSWAGWKEPWNRSDGLLLEYAHILTCGDRLDAVLAEQVDRRLRESRDAELAALRVTALAGAAGAMIDTARLPGVLALNPGDLTRALRRLIDEHLVAEPVAGRLAGLHQLRSTTLFRLCHACPPPLPSSTIVEAVRAATNESLGVLAAHVLVSRPEDAPVLMQALLARLERERDPAAAVAVLTGLGRAHIETTLRQWLPEALALGLAPTQVTLAIQFAVTGIALPALSFPECLKEAIHLFPRGSLADPRPALVSALSPATISALIATADTKHLRVLLGSLVGCEIPEGIKSTLLAIRPSFDDEALEDAADLLGTARLIDPDIALAWTGQGVRERLLARVPAEIPWTGPVDIEAAPEGRLIRGLIWHVAPSVQTDVHGDAVKLCGLLLGLDPTADVVAVEALAADGLPAGLADHPLAVNRIPRENLPPSALPKWNRQWMTAAARLVGNDSHTDYLQRARSLLERLVPALEHAVDRLLRGKMTPRKVLEHLGDVHDAARALTPPRDGLLDEDAPEMHVTRLQNILFACSADLVRRCIQLPEGHGAYGAWTSGLLKELEEVRREPWDLIGGVPDDLLRRLEQQIAGLRLLAVEAGARGENPLRLWAPQASKGRRGNALRLIQAAVEPQMQKRSADDLQRVKAALTGAGVDAVVDARPDWTMPVPWSSPQLLMIVDLNSLADWQPWLLTHGPSVRAAAGESRHVHVVPRVAGHAVSRLTISGVLTLVPKPYAADDWLEELSVRRLDDKFARDAQPVIDLLVELGGLRRFGFGGEGRPATETSVRITNERRLAECLAAFETLAEGAPVQSLLRHLADEVAAGHFELDPPGWTGKAASLARLRGLARF